MKDKLGPYQSIVEEAAKAFDLDPRLINAIIWRESAGDPNACRYEPLYQYIYKPYNKSMRDYCRDLGMEIETETNLQKYSWGLMQVMGGVARELGFNDRWLHKLTDAAYGIKYGCAKLSRLQKQYPNLKDVISSYNAGSVRKDNLGNYINQSYVDFVITTMGEF